MPPSPTITATLNEKQYAKLCETLELPSPPPVRFVRSPRQHAQAFGVYRHDTRSIEIHLNMRAYDSDGLRFVNSEIVITLLHELRHAWQHHTHGDDFRTVMGGIVAVELDAEDFARVHASTQRSIVRVSRRFHGSGLSRLAKTERTVRRVV